MSFSGLHKSIKATVAGTAFAKSVANAAPAVPISRMIIKNGSRNRFSVMPPRFNNIGLTVSPCAWCTAENMFTIYKNGISQMTTRR